MASSKAVRRRGTAKTSLFWISSTELVKSLIASGSSEKVIMKNSSCGLAVLKNSITASLARSILLAMLPLESKITPRDTGASSLEKVRISCWLLPSYNWKLSFSSPVTRRFIGSVMVTGTRTRSTSTFSGRTCALKPEVEEAGTSGGGVEGLGAGSSRGTTWTSFTSVWAKPRIPRENRAKNPKTTLRKRVDLAKLGRERGAGSEHTQALWHTRGARPAVQ